jgi:hypothetical protein
MRAHYDQISFALLRVLDDQIGRPASDGFEQHSFRLERMLEYDTLRFGKNLLPLRLERVDELLDRSTRDVHPQREHFIYDVDQMQLRSVALGNLDRLSQPSIEGSLPSTGTSNCCT